MAQARMDGLFTASFFLRSLDRYLCVLWAVGYPSHSVFFFRYLQSNNASPGGSEMCWVIIVGFSQEGISLHWDSASPNEKSWTKPSLEHFPRPTSTEAMRKVSLPWPRQGNRASQDTGRARVSLPNSCLANTSYRDRSKPQEALSKDTGRKSY